MVTIEFIFIENYRFSRYIFFVMVMVEFIFRELQPAFCMYVNLFCDLQLWIPVLPPGLFQNAICSYNDRSRFCSWDLPSPVYVCSTIFFGCRHCFVLLQTSWLLLDFYKGLAAAASSPKCKELKPTGALRRGPYNTIQR